MPDRSTPPPSPEAEELDITDEERELAEALARALEGPGARSTEVDGELSELVHTAALVETSQRLELRAERQAALKEDLERTFVEHRQKHRASADREAPASPWSALVRWLPLPLAAAAALVFWIRSSSMETESDGRPAAIAEQAERAAEPAFAENLPQAPARGASANSWPRPSDRLLQAQARAISARATELPSLPPTAERPLRSSEPDLDRELRAYRSQMLAVLDRRLRP